MKYSDHPYADTGGNPAPDLVVGRIVGDSASRLIKPIQASIGVHKDTSGYAFERDNATLISGPGYGLFEQDIEDIAYILDNEFSVKKNHCNDYFYVSTPIYHNFDQNDGYAVGDVMCDAED